MDVIFSKTNFWHYLFIYFYGLYGDSISKPIVCTEQEWIDLFPNNKAIQGFYAMTLYNVKQHEKLMELLLKVLIHTTHDEEIIGYKKAIEFYADKVDEVWE